MTNDLNIPNLLYLNLPCELNIIISLAKLINSLPRLLFSCRGARSQRRRLTEKNARSLPGIIQRRGLLLKRGSGAEGRQDIDIDLPLSSKPQPDQGQGQAPVEIEGGTTSSSRKRSISQMTPNTEPSVRTRKRHTLNEDDKRRMSDYGPTFHDLNK